MPAALAKGSRWCLGSLVAGLPAAADSDLQEPRAEYSEPVPASKLADSPAATDQSSVQAVCQQAVAAAEKFLVAAGPSKDWSVAREVMARNINRQSTRYSGFSKFDVALS